MKPSTNPISRILLIAAFLLVSGALTASAGSSLYKQSIGFNDLSDQRTFTFGTENYAPSSSQGGLSGYWAASSTFTINWDITCDPGTSLWSYAYNLSSSEKAISHFILELTDSASASDIIDPRVNGQSVSFDGPTAWSGGNSNPSMPADIYGIKFDCGGNSVTYSFETLRDPVWGNFYAKDGNDTADPHNPLDVYAFNNALGITGFASDKKIDFIARPNGGGCPPVVPEPISAILFVSGGITMTALRLKKSRKK